MQPRRLEEPVAVRRCHLLLVRAPVAIVFDRNLDSGLAEGPDAAEHAGEAAYVFASDAQYHIAGAQPGTLGRTAISEADHHDAVVDFGSIEAEPRAGRTIGPAVPQQVVEDRLEEIDRHDHVEMARYAAFAPLLQLQRT